MFSFIMNSKKQKINTELSNYIKKSNEKLCNKKKIYPINQFLKSQTQEAQIDTFYLFQSFEPN